MRNWYCEYLFEGANGPRFMTVTARDMSEAIKRFDRELETNSGVDKRSLSELTIKEVV